MCYGIVIEKAEHNYTTYVPDLPGCIAAGESLEETEEAIKQAIQFHIEGLLEDGLPIPKSNTVLLNVEAAVQ